MNYIQLLYMLFQTYKKCELVLEWFKSRDNIFDTDILSSGVVVMGKY